MGPGISLLGMVSLLAIGVVLSKNRRAIQVRTVTTARLRARAGDLRSA